MIGLVVVGKLDNKLGRETEGIEAVSKFECFNSGAVETVRT